MDDLEFLILRESEIGVELDCETAAELLTYKNIVMSANEKFNLTAIKEDGEFIVKHLVDSLLGASEIPFGARLCDIGSGAGFPCVPLAAARKDICAVALDSTAKKMNFVSEAAKSIGLGNVSTVAGRAEEQKNLFGAFDAVTARAVSSLPVLLELAIPLLKVGGVFIAYKTDDGELEISKRALSELGAKCVNIKSAALYGGDKRTVLVFEKLKATNPKYPRLYGAIKKNPL